MIAAGTSGTVSLGGTVIVSVTKVVGTLVLLVVDDELELVEDEVDDEDDEADVEDSGGGGSDVTSGTDDGATVVGVVVARGARASSRGPLPPVSPAAARPANTPTTATPAIPTLSSTRPWVLSGTPALLGDPSRVRGSLSVKASVVVAAGQL
ncbi:MAG: hypothetical protein HYX32_00650 [Actinobacteria bacterium]|nr:hypothetical protein [Actinomycetota bacterium]